MSRRATARARRDYFIENTYEAGIALAGTEVKSLRQGQGSINEAYASEQGGEIYLINSHIPEYQSGGHFNHDPRRARKLLMHRREIARLIGLVRREGFTLVPLSLYFTPRGIAKVELAPGQGQAAPRQARSRQGPRLEAPEGPPDAGKGVRGAKTDPEISLQRHAVFWHNRSGNERGHHETCRCRGSFLCPCRFSGDTIFPPPAMLN